MPKHISFLGMNKIALATVCTPNFIRGTQTLFHSFCRHNPDLEIDLIVICDEELDSFRKAFESFPSVKFHYVGEELKEAIRYIEKQSGNDGKNTNSRFCCLEFFALADYDKALFMDSDMVCLRSVSELFNKDDAFYACADRLFYQGLVRNKSTFEVESSESESIHQAISPTYNTGFMLVSNQYLSSRVYQELIQQLYANDWSQLAKGLNDQIVINQCFNAEIIRLSAAYNFILKFEKDIGKTDRVSVGNSNVLHWIGYPKPWEFKRIFKRIIRGNKTPERWFFWLRCYWSYLIRSNWFISLTLACLYS